MRFIDITGQKFNHLQVLERVPGTSGNVNVIAEK